jgi:hypothetical protein
MAHIGFRGRPVAALANETRFRSDVRPGSTLDLAVDIESCDEHAVAYAGRASVDGKEAIELVDCLGPMLPVEEFDSPVEMAERFELIRGKARSRDASKESPRRSSCAPEASPAYRRAPRFRSRSRRRSFAITSRAVRSSLPRCCSIRRSALRSSLRTKQASGPPERGPRRRE